MASNKDSLVHACIRMTDEGKQVFPFGFEEHPEHYEEGEEMPAILKLESDREEAHG